MKRTLMNQAGFSHSMILVVVLVVAVIGLAGNTVYQANKNKQEEARITQEKELKDKAELTLKQKAEEQAEEIAVPEPKVEEKKVETPKVEKKPVDKKATEKKEIPYKAIPTVSADIQEDEVLLTAKLPASYAAGKCSAYVKHTDGSNARHYYGTFSNADTCQVIAPRSELTTASEWKYYMSFQTSDTTAKGDHGGNVFVL